MQDYIIVGCDMHDESMLLRIALNTGEAVTRTYGTSREGRQRAIAELRKRGAEVGDVKGVFAYEASLLGYGMHDDLVDAGMTCYVFAPTRIAHTAKSKRNKCDEKDAQKLLEILRAHLFAGNELPSIWVPDPVTRDDRELVRARLDLVDKRTSLRAQVRTLLKRNDAGKPIGVGQSWTKPYQAWLESLGKSPTSPLGLGARMALQSLLSQLQGVEEAMHPLDTAIEALSQADRYRPAMQALVALKGVGLLTAMVYLTEMGDLHRFTNRRQVASYLGLVPSSHESGPDADCKGHITHQGPPRIRRVLCQAEWSRVGTDPEETTWYEQVVARNPKKKKVARVGGMRRLGIQMWRRALEVMVAHETSMPMVESVPRDFQTPTTPLPPESGKRKAPAFVEGMKGETWKTGVSLA